MALFDDIGLTNTTNVDNPLLLIRQDATVDMGLTNFIGSKINDIFNTLPNPTIPNDLEYKIKYTIEKYSKIKNQELAKQRSDLISNSQSGLRIMIAIEPDVIPVNEINKVKDAVVVAYKQKQAENIYHQTKIPIILSEIVDSKLKFYTDYLTRVGVNLYISPPIVSYEVKEPEIKVTDLVPKNLANSPTKEFKLNIKTIGLIGLAILLLRK